MVGLFGLYLALAAGRPAGIFWSLDEGGKFLYLQSVLASGDPRAPLPYPGRGLDPGLEAVPLFYWIKAGAEIYPWWPVGFPLLSLPFYQVFGWLGLYIVPAVLPGRADNMHQRGRKTSEMGRETGCPSGSPSSWTGVRRRVSPS